MYLIFKLKRALAGLLVVAAGIAGVLAASYLQSAQNVASKQREAQIPIIMYHSLLKDPGLQGKYVISPEVLENDMKYLKEKGYTAVNVQDLLDFVDGKKELPEKPVILSFDDGYYNNYYYAYPLAKQYNMKIVIAPIGSCTDKFSATTDEHIPYSHITWDEIKEMMASGLVEFQNHTYDLHTNKQGKVGVKKMAGETDEAYQKRLAGDVVKMQQRMKENTGYEPSCFVYPFGAKSEKTAELIKEMGFRCTFTCESKVNTISRNPESLYELGRFLRTGKKSSAEFCGEILD